jgi:hypothetical protein
MMNNRRLRCASPPVIHHAAASAARKYALADLTLCADGNWYCQPFGFPISCRSQGQVGYRRRNLLAKGRLPPKLPTMIE